MPRFRSCLGWTLSLTLLAGLAGFLYVLLPPAPRWRVEGQRLLTLQSAAFNPLAPSRFQPLLPGRDVLLTCGGQHDDTGPVVLRDPLTGQVRRTLIAAAEKIACAELSADGRLLAVSLEKQDDVRLFDLHAGTEARTSSLAAESDDLVFAADGRTLAVRTVERRVFLIAATTGEILSKSPQQSVQQGSYAFTPEGALFLCPARTAQDQEPCLKAWDTRQRRWTFTLDNTAVVWQVSPDGKTILCLRKQEGRENEWVIWDLPSRTCRPLDFNTDSEPFCGFAVQPRTMGLWLDPRRGQASHFELRELPSQRRLSKFALGQLLDVQLAPDGRYLAGCIDTDSRPSPSLLVYATAPGQLLWQRPWPAALFGDGVNAPTFSADGRQLFAPAMDLRQLDLLDAATGEVQATIPLQPWPGKLPDLLRLTFTQDRNRCLLTATWRKPPERPPLLARLRRGLLGDKLEEDRRRMYRVVDIAGRHELSALELTIRNLTTRSAQLTADGHTLVTAEVLQGNAPAELLPRLEGWDLPPSKPWRWVLGPPLGLGLLLLLGRAGLRRRARLRSARPHSIEAQRGESSEPEAYV